jgi:hypothetical protein
MIMTTLLLDRNLSAKHSGFDKIIHSLVPRRNEGEWLKDLWN